MPVLSMVMVMRMIMVVRMVLNMFMRMTMLMAMFVFVLVVGVLHPGRDRNDRRRLRIEQSPKQQHQHRAA